MQNIKEVISRIKEVLGVEKQKEIAEKLGVSPSAIDNWHRRKKIPEKSLLKISQMTDTTIDWLLTGKGRKELIKSHEALMLLDEEKYFYSFDILRLNASAGHGIEHFDIEVEDEPEKIKISKNFFKTPLNQQVIKVIEVQGDSMEPTIKDGSYILIDTTKTDTIDGIYAILLDNEIFVKRLQFNIDKTISIISDNKNYKEQLYKPSSDIYFKILGRKILSIQP